MAKSALSAVSSTILQNIAEASLIRPIPQNRLNSVEIQVTQMMIDHYTLMPS